MSQLLKKLLAIAVFCGAVIACSSTKPPKPAVESAPAIELPPAPVVASEPVASSPVATSHNSVYFAFNKYDIKDQYQGIVSANGMYLVGHTDAEVQVQGNTDDIGSVEYNLALGQRRADAVKKALVAAGASPAQIEAVSYGKLKPKYANDTDAMRAQNRRSDMVYKKMQPSGYSLDSTLMLPMVDGSFYAGTVVEGVQ